MERGWGEEAHSNLSKDILGGSELPVSASVYKDAS